MFMCMCVCPALRPATRCALSHVSTIYNPLDHTHAYSPHKICNTTTHYTIHNPTQPYTPHHPHTTSDTRTHSLRTTRIVNKTLQYYHPLHIRIHLILILHITCFTQRMCLSTGPLCATRVSSLSRYAHRTTRYNIIDNMTLLVVLV